MNGQSQQPTVQEQPVGDGQGIQVKVISPSAAREEKTTRISAVFVAHGMGQQRKIETLNLIADGLIKHDTEEVRKTTGPTPEVVTIDTRDGYLHGVKLRLKGENAEPEAHVFEGYWAPLAEGAVSLRELMAFLVGAGLNGLAKTGRPFIRFLFNTRHSFPADFRVTILLLTAMLVVAALVIMNMAIVTVAALKSPLTNSPDWLPGLQLDLTTLFNLFLIVAGVFGLIILLSYTLRDCVGTGDKSSQNSQEKKKKSLARRESLIKPSIALFVATIGTTIACGLAIPLLFYGHAYGPQPPPSPPPEYLKEAFGAGSVSIINCAFSLILLLIVILLLVRAAGKIKNILQQRKEFKTVFQQGKNEPSLSPKSKFLLWGAAVVMLAIILALGISLVVTILRHLPGDWPAFTDFNSIKENPWTALKSASDSLSVLSWPLLIVVSWYVCGLLVQYVGDVALYVASHKLDRFNSLRENIRKTVYTAAAAVYEAPAPTGDGFAYDNVFIVGHSLGAVVVYDTLNRLINESELRNRKLNEDEARGRTLAEDELRERKLNVAGRTKLLLTFGSPQDKIAFLFARPESEKQPEKRTDTGSKGTGTGTVFIPIREALVAASQPLVQSADFRQFEWVNIYSKQDIISGRLDFFDQPPGEGTGHRQKPVLNLEDKEACTLLAAHVEYWDNSKLREILHEQITKNA